VMVEPERVPLFDKAKWGMTHEQELAVAEAVLEVAEKDILRTRRDAIGGVHEAEGPWFVHERDPRGPQRPLPAVREIESVPQLVGRSPKAHALDPGGRIGIARRRVLDERVFEDGRPLSLVWADVVEHDSAETGSHLVERGEEYPCRPLSLRRE